MSKIYSIENTQDNSMREYCPFNIQDQDVVIKGGSTYNEVLKILREAFKMVDITQIISKS